MPRLTDPSATERPIPRFIGGSAAVQPVSGLTAEGTAVMQLGDEMQRAISIEQEKVDTTKVEDAWNQYKNAALDATMGEKGVLRRQGAEAVNGNILKELTTSLQDRRKRIAEGLGTDEQRQRFLTRADATDLQVKHQTLAHIAEQTNAYALTVFQGSEAAANAQVAAMPTDPGVFAGARDTLFAQTEALLRGKGVTDKDEIQRAKDKVNDKLWETRIDTLLYSQPMLAEAVLRANEKEIKDPKMRLLLQAKTREAALGVSANIEAKKVVDEVRQATPPASGAGTFQNVVGSLLRREGGFVATDGLSGAPANFGINQRANPDVDVKNLTREKAIEIYRKRYWDAIQGDRLPPATALVALDAAALQGTEVARKLLEETNGDPMAMIARRREQLKSIVEKNPKQAANLPGWMARLDSLEAEVKDMGAGGMVKMSAQDPVAQNTSGLPSSRDIAAQLPRMLARVEERANALYGTDQGNPDRAAFIRRMSNEIQAAVSSDVQQLNAIQRQAQGLLIDAVAGLGGPRAGVMPTGGAAAAPSKGITSFAQIQADPKLFQAWQMMDPQAKLSIERLMEHNLRSTDKGDDAMYRELWNRVHLEPGDPRKIDFYAQIVKPDIADRLSIQQIGQLRLEIDRSETPGGRSIAQMRRAAESKVGAYFKTHIMFTAQPERQIAAEMRWMEDVGRKIDDYVKNNQQEKVRSMFTLDSPDSVVSPQYLQTYINSTPAQGLAEAAARAAQAPAVPPAAQPKEIDSREKLEAWFQTLPPTVTSFVGTDGKVRLIPGRQAAPTAPAAEGQPAPAQPAPAAMLETGQLAPPAPPAPAPAQEPTIADIEIYKPMTVAEAAAAKGKKMKSTRERERQLLALEGRLGLLEGLGATAKALGTAAFYPYVQGYRSFVQTGERIAQAIPPERDAVLSAWADIKRTRVVSAYDRELIERALEYGLTAPDEKLARGILKKLEGAN